MKDIAPLIEQLAAKLGTTVEYLWQILLKQVQVEIRLAEMGMTISFVLYAIAAVLFIVAFVRRIKDDDYGLAVYWILGVYVVTSIAVTLHILNYIQLVTLKNNPEYWALQEVLKHLQ